MKNLKPKLAAFALPAICSMAFFAMSAPAQSLVHRYSFNDSPGSSTFVDTVGGLDGALIQGTSSNPNSAYLNGAELQLDGTGGYGLLPAGLISSYSQVTIEFWATYSNNPVWTRTFAFGDQTSGGLANSALDYTHFAGGDYENLNFQTNSAGPSTYVNNPGGLDGRTNVHVTVVVDPAHNTMYYYNGTALRSSAVQSGATVFPLNQLTDTYGLIGRSLIDADMTLAGSVSEFRIYSGTLSVSNIVLNDASSPGTLVTTPGGALSAIHVVSPVNPLAIGQVSQQILKGDFPNVSGVDLLAYGSSGGSTANFTSSDMSVLTVNPATGVVTAVAPGTATVTAKYGAFTTTASLTVVAIPATLTHRYSFASDASDSIGGANGTLQGSASITGGRLVLDGVSGSYLDLPGAILNLKTNKAITLEAWATIDSANGTWARLFEFGNGTGGADFYCAPQVQGANNNHWSLSQNYGSGSQTIGLAATWSGTTAHHVWVIDPTTSRLESYVNGVLEYSLQNATAPISGIATNSAWLGKSPYADPFLVGSVDEFRIYSGALTAQEVASSYTSGPAGIAHDPGALQSLKVPSMSVPAYSGLFAPTILATYANLADFGLIANSSAASVSGLTLTSSDTNILTFTGNNMLRTLRPGIVTVTATYLGKTASGNISVENLGVLTHRYSFTTDASDSVGSANGLNNGAAVETGGQLVLDGSSGTFVSLPANILDGYDAVTIDTWVTLNSQGSWARLWFFGDNQNNEFYLAPNTLGGTTHRISAGVRDGRTADDAPVWQNQTIHITTVFGNGTMELYSNSVPVHTYNDIIAPLSQVGKTLAWIGKSPYADPFMNCNVDEFRIYKGRLSADQIQASDLLGVNQVLTTNVSLKITQTGGNNVMSWPLAAAGFVVQSRTDLASGNWATLTNAPAVVGNANWVITLPVSGSQQFYRLWR